MENNKRFFICPTGRGVITTGVGVSYPNFNLRRVLGSIYDKYEVFNLTLEGFMPEGGSKASTDDNAFCLHVSGLPFMSNHYDSLQQNSSSRVVELMMWDVQSWYFLKNIHKLQFYKPSTAVVSLTIFTTTMTGVVSERTNTVTSGTNFNLWFSITGNDAYRVRRIPKPLIYRGFNKANPTLVLNSNYATSIDPIDATLPKKRIFRFENVNWRTIIGNELYDKYGKFALVVRRIANMPLNKNYVNGFGTQPLYLSGSNLIFENAFEPIMNSTSEMINLHGGNYPVTIGQIRAPVQRDMYIENVFLKPFQDIGTITIHHSAINTNGLAIGSNGPNMSSSSLYPTLVIHFEIIPVVDVLA